jgi:uncharacterized LabA/DUF88 family protein
MQQRVAVFVDGENIGSAHAAAIASIAEKQGEIVLARVYGDVGRLNGWQEARRYKVVHAGKGKNATDLLLSLDALEMALERRFDICIVASSDRDFSHLAVKLRERGLRVIGTGETKTPELFRDVCSKFHKLDASKCPVKAVTIPVEPRETARDRQICELVMAQPDGTTMTIKLLGSLMKTKWGVGRNDIEDGNWRAYLSRRPALYEIDPPSDGARVRLKATSPVI